MAEPKESTPNSGPEAQAPAEIPGPAGIPERLTSRAARASEIHDRLTIFVVRALFFFMAGGIGYYCAVLFGDAGINPFLTILSSCGIALLVILVEAFFSKAPIRTISAITFGLIIGLVMSALFQPVIELIVQYRIEETEPRKQLMQFLNLISTTVFCFFGITLLLQTKDDFKFIIPFVEFRKEVKGHAPLILDTSAIIDGRIQALLATGVLDQRLVVPKFIFDELQAIADSADRSRRERGRRGMDILDQICRDYRAEIMDRTVQSGGDVDAALLDLVAEAGGKLVTTDYNLQKRAKLQGMNVINLNDLASALKPAIVPGEVLRVKLLRPGEDSGQAVGFLADGTMVVVENSSRKIGQEVTIEVTSAIQTSAGKMIFGRLKRSPGGREERSGRSGAQRRAERQ